MDHNPALAGASAEAFDQLAERIQNTSGTTRDLTLASAGTLAKFGLTEDQITTMLPIIDDYSKATGTDVPTAAKQVGLALMGNTRALKGLGIGFKATGDRGKDFQTIVGALTSKVGGMGAAYGKTLPGQMDIFKGRLHDLEIEAGQKLLPVAEAVVQAFTDLLPVLKPILDNLIPLAGGFLAFKAVQFLPKLLFAVGTGFQKMGAQKAAGAINGAATSLQGMSSVLGPIAAVGLPLITIGMQQAAQQAEHNREATAALVDELLRGKTTIAKVRAEFSKNATNVPDWARAQMWEHVNEAIDTYRKKQAKLAEQQAKTTEQTNKLSGSLGHYRERFSGLLQVTGQSWTSFVSDFTSAANKGDLQGFWQKQVDAVKKWREQVAQNLNFVSGALDDFAGHSNISADTIVKSFQRHLHEMQQFGNDLTQIVQRASADQKGAAKDLVFALQQMGDQGIGLAHSIAGANDKAFGQVIGTWGKAKKSSEDLALKLQRSLLGVMHKIYDVMLAIAKSKNIDLHIKEHGAAHVKAALNEIVSYDGHEIHFTTSAGGEINPRPSSVGGGNSTPTAPAMAYNAASMTGGNRGAAHGSSKPPVSVTLNVTTTGAMSEESLAQAISRHFTSALNEAGY
jgi:hypothetical protein